VIKARAQAKVWRDAPALWSEVAAVYPNQPVALMRVGDAFLFERRLDLAVRVYEEVTRRFPEFVTVRLPHGNALEAMGRVVEAERVLADGARQAPQDLFRDRYGFFLIAHPRIEPSDPVAAKRSMVLIAPLLAARGKRPAGIQRAIDLLGRYGRDDLVQALRARLDTLERRRP
jgi:hypothetical protein